MLYSICQGALVTHILSLNPIHTEQRLRQLPSLRFIDEVEQSQCRSRLGWVLWRLLMWNAEACDGTPERLRRDGFFGWVENI